MIGLLSGPPERGLPAVFHFAVVFSFFTIESLSLSPIYILIYIF